MKSKDMQKIIIKALQIKTTCRQHNPPTRIADTEKDFERIDEKASEIIQMIHKEDTNAKQNQ